MEIFTPNQLWEDFDPATEQLDSDVFAVRDYDGVEVKKLYFNGTVFPNGHKTRVLGVVCRPQEGDATKGVLVVGDYRKPVCVDDLVALAKNGFVVMSVDYAGRGNLGTIYPEEQDYLNADVAESLYYVGNSVKDNKIYEYVKNTRRAIGYMLAEEGVDELSVVGVESGSYIGTIVLGTDTRISRGTVVFGPLYATYPLNEADNAELSERLAEEDVARAWTMGLAPQSYLMQISAPLYVVISANSANVDIVEAGKMYYRVNDDSRLLILPTTLDYLPQKYIDSVVDWLKGETVEEDFDLTSFEENGSYGLKLATKSSVENTSVWYCVNPSHPARYWTKADLTPCDDGFTAAIDVYEKDCEVAAFCLIDGKVAVSSALTEVKVHNAANVRLPGNVVFSGAGGQSLIPVREQSGWWGQNIDARLAKGFLGIVGMEGDGFATFGICDPSVKRSQSFTVSFDVCTDVRQKLKIYVVCGYGRDNMTYVCTAKLIGDGKWQRVTVENADFHRVDDSRPMTDEDRPDCLEIFSESKVIVNNIIVV